MDDIALAIASQLADYRKGEIPQIDPDHVLRWAGQFEDDDRQPLLAELNYVLGKTYITRKSAENFLNSIVDNENISGDDPSSFWKNVNLLDIQIQGHSQSDMLFMLRDIIINKLNVTNRGGSNIYVYIDDAMFTGNRIRNDLESWLKGAAPAEGVVHIIVLVTHGFSEWKLTQNLESEANKIGKRIKFNLWRWRVLENRKYHRNNSDVLWPAELPDDVAAYVAGRSFEARQPGGVGKVFSSNDARSRMEQILLRAGMRIRGFSANPNASLKPLGFGPFGVGFGATLATYRNCPNNAPLALWWGDPNAGIGHPFRRWTPLLPRKTYGGN